MRFACLEMRDDCAQILTLEFLKDADGIAFFTPKLLGYTIQVYYQVCGISQITSIVVLARMQCWTSSGT